MDRLIKTNYRLVKKAETRRAERIAARVLGIRPISVWEVLIPVIFIFGFIQSRQRRDLFAQNLLFTKKFALEGARDMRLKQVSRSDVLAGFINQSNAILDQDQGGIYSQDIQQYQYREIDLLLTHYQKLINVRGDSHEALIQAAYPKAGLYQFFIQSLITIEDQVMTAAQSTLGRKADAKTLERLRNYSKQDYENQIQRLYFQKEADIQNFYN